MMFSLKLRSFPFARPCRARQGLSSGASSRAAAAAAREAAPRKAAERVPLESLEARTLMSSSLWGDAAVPTVAAVASPPAEVGVRFSSDTDGYITGLRFYKGPGNTGVHVGTLWTTAGVALGRATFQNETAAGFHFSVVPHLFLRPLQRVRRCNYGCCDYRPECEHAHYGSYAVCRSLLFHLKPFCHCSNSC